MATTLNNFLQQLTDSGLVSAEELQQIQSRALAAKSGTEDAAELARELVKQKKLTKFQAEQLYAGKGKSLTLGNYVLLDKLGEGGMGMVLKAWHRRMERIVALKVIAPKVVKEPSALKRFQREVIAAAKLTHPNIVAAHDADEAKGTHFLVMEYVEGSDLSSWVKEHGPLPVEQAVSCIVQAARGLAFAHDQGVVHRDIKPHNLLMDHSGTVKILDMGLARIEGGFGGSAEHADLTRSGAMMGTVDYMSPEQAMDSKHADARSDIYSLGCTLFYLVTGHVAFEADTVMKRLTAHQSAPPPALDQEVQSVYSGTSSGAQGSSATRLPSVLPAHLVALNAVFQRMVAKKPEDRQQSMLQVVAELDRCAMSGSATVSVASGSNPVAKPSTPANVSNRDADTIIDSSSDSKTNGLSDATVVLDSSVVKNPTTGATTSSIKSRKMILISVVTVALLLVIAWAMSGKSGKPPAENDKEVAQVEKTSSGRPVASSSEHSTDHALEFDGDDLVSMESVPEYSTESMTLEAFVRVDSIPQDGFIYSLGGNGGLQVMANGGRWWFAMVGHQGGWFSLPSSEPIPLQRRVHLAGVCDKSEFRLYVDGKLIGQPKSTIGSKFKPPGGAALIGLNLCGTIDEVRVSKTARYSAAFTPAARHESDADTLALYHFDEGQGDRLVDSSGNNHHGKIVGAKWVKADSSAIAPALANAAVGAPATTASATPQPSALDAALKFDGLQSHVQTPLVHGGNTPLTIEFTLLPGPRQNAVISDSEAMGMGIDILNNSISFLAFRRVNDKADYVRITAPRSLAADRAYRIATVYDNGTLWLFVDGKLEASADLKGEYLPSNLPFYLGASPEGEGIDYPYTGTLDEVRFSKVARYKTDYSPVARLTTDTDTLALYHFDEGTGEVLKDSSGSDHHGKIVGAKWVKADVAAVSHAKPASVSSNLMTESFFQFHLKLDSSAFSRDAEGLILDQTVPGGRYPLVTGTSWSPDQTVLKARFRELASAEGESGVWIGFNTDIENGRLYARLLTTQNERKWVLSKLPNWRDYETNVVLAETPASKVVDGVRDVEFRFVNGKVELFEAGRLIVSASNVEARLGKPVFGAHRSKWRLERWTAERPENSAAWTDWLGPKLKRGDFNANNDGWLREGDAVTTDQVISGIEVLPTSTRNGAMRLTYLLRDSAGIQINARDRKTGETRDVYMVEDNGTQLSIVRFRTGSPYNYLVKQAIPVSIAKDSPRTLEFRVVGDTLTATINGSVVATVKDATLSDGNFALVALKGVLVQKVEYQLLDEPTAKSSVIKPVPVVTPPLVTKPTNNISPDRRAAEWVIAQGGEVTLSSGQGWVANVNDLPEGELEIKQIKFLKPFSGENADLIPMRELKHLVFTEIDYAQPSGSGIAGLERLPKLARISCGGHLLTDEQVAGLVRLKNVTGLYLVGAKLTPARCATLAKSMPQLKSLNLINNPLLDDAAVAPLGKLSNLNRLQLQGTKVTAAGIAALQQALPNCSIEWDGAKK